MKLKIPSKKIFYKELYKNSKNEKFIIYVITYRYVTFSEKEEVPQIEIYRYDEVLDKTDNINLDNILRPNGFILAKIDYGQYEYALTLYEDGNAFFSVYKLEEILDEVYKNFNINLSKNILTKYEELLVLYKLNDFKGGN